MLSQLWSYSFEHIVSNNIGPQNYVKALLSWIGIG